MRKQKHVGFTDLADLLDHLETNSDKYKTRMLDLDTVFIGDVYIRRYYNIDPENTDAQYVVIVDDNEYRILPNNKIWIKWSGHYLDSYVQMLNYSESDAKNMWYQIAIIHQTAINKNIKKFINSQPKRDLILIFITLIISNLMASMVRNSHDKKQDKVQNTTEISVDTTKTQINPVDTIMYNAVQHTK